MKNIFNFKAILVVLALVGASACDSFDVSNENPDVATNIENNPELLLTNALRNSVRTTVRDAWSEGNLMAQYGARIVFTSFDLFDWGDQGGTWRSHYLSIRDLEELKKIAIATNNTSYEAIAITMQSWLFQIMTDMWGDIPYSQATQANAEDPVFQPTYDAQEAIYTDLLSELKRAGDLFAGANIPVKGDILFNGDLTKWRKFANSLRLRVALRLSEANSSVAQSTIAEIVNNASAYPVMESNADNADLAFLPTNPNAHPITEESVYRVGSYNEYRIAETFEGLLTATDDPRLPFFADPTAASVADGTPKIEAMQNGIVDGPAYVYKGGDAFLSKFNINYFYFTSNANEGRLMTYSEVAFIMAEAAQKGWISGEAESFYNAGIEANFAYWDVTMPTDFMSRTGIAFDGTLEQIANQKYIALFYTDYQGFIEYKRTGFPSTIQPGPDAFLPNYPSRFEYPSEEGALNADNLAAAISRQGPDEISTKVWWEK